MYHAKKMKIGHESIPQTCSRYPFSFFCYDTFVIFACTCVKMTHVSQKKMKIGHGSMSGGCSRDLFSFFLHDTFVIFRKSEVSQLWCVSRQLDAKGCFSDCLRLGVQQLPEEIAFSLSSDARPARVDNLRFAENDECIMQKNENRSREHPPDMLPLPFFIFLL